MCLSAINNIVNQTRADEEETTELKKKNRECCPTPGKIITPLISSNTL